MTEIDSESDEEDRSVLCIFFLNKFFSSQHKLNLFAL